MAICYKLQEAGRPSEDQDAQALSSLIPVDALEAQTSDTPIVAILSKQEFVQLGLEQPGAHESLDALTAAESNYVDLCPAYIVGSLAVPSRTDTGSEPSLYAFYMDRHQLIFVDEGESAKRALEHVIDIGVLSGATTGHCLYVFFKELLVNDLKSLGTLEDEMECIEEQLLDADSDIPSGTIMRYRRQTMRLDVYYQEMATMASILSDNENKLMDDAVSPAFDHIESLADRLATRAETLKEYSLQLHELQQTRIDLKQNSIMQVFTIVTVLFAPLTLVTGWFGMNLSLIPGLDWPYMWAVLVAAALLCTGGLLAFFKWKKWL